MLYSYNLTKVKINYELWFINMNYLQTKKRSLYGLRFL